MKQVFKHLTYLLIVMFAATFLLLVSKTQASDLPKLEWEVGDWVEIPIICENPITVMTIVGHAAIDIDNASVMIKTAIDDGLCVINEYGLVGMLVEKLAMYTTIEKNKGQVWSVNINGTLVYTWLFSNSKEDNKHNGVDSKET